MRKVSELIAEQQNDVNSDGVKDIWGGLFYNVRVFGAKGNGLNDDTSAIQAAIDAVYNEGGGKVLFPSGTYRTTGTIIMKPRVLLEGTIPGNVYYNSSHVAAPTIKYDGGDWAIKFTESPNASQAGLKNINFVGNSSAKGGIKINDAILGPDPSLDNYFEAVCVSQFPHGYGVKMINTYRSVWYTLVVRQCGAGVSTLDGTNDITFVDPTVEWCALGLDLVKSSGIYIFGLLAEGLGVRPDVWLPNDLFTVPGTTVLSDYYGGVRNFGSNVTITGGYMEYIDQGKLFMLELDSVQTITGMELQVTANTEKYIVDKTSGAKCLVFTGNRIFASPTIACINLSNSTFNCFIQGNWWHGTRSVEFFTNIGTHIDGGLIQAPDKPSEVMLSYEHRVYARDVNFTSGFKLMGPYIRGPLDNYWEFYRQNGEGPGKFAAIRRVDNGVDEGYMLFDDNGVHPVKPLVFDTQITEEAAPLSGLFVDVTDGKLKFKNENGTVISWY